MLCERGHYQPDTTSSSCICCARGFFFEQFWTHLLF
jgi:hypothetical protein